MSVNPPDLSIIVPCYRSSSSLEALAGRLEQVFKNQGKTWELILVDDCSPDPKTWQTIEALKSRFGERVQGVRLARNVGQHNATLCGLRLASGAWIVTIDDDLQIPPEEISKLIEKQRVSGADLVYGTFPKKEHGWFRNLGSRLLTSLAMRAFRSEVRGSSFRLIRGEIARNAQAHRHPVVHLDGLLLWYTRSLAEVSVDHQDRREGSSGYGFFKLMELAIRFLLNFTTYPLTLLTVIGFTLSGISFLGGIYYLVRKWLYGAQLGYTSLIVAILFSTGVIVLALGILGAYLQRMLLLLSDRPQYSVERKI